MYLESENNLFKSLKILKKNFSVQGIKAEFEAEGSNQFDIYKLRSLTNKLVRNSGLGSSPSFRSLFSFRNFSGI